LTPPLVNRGLSDNHNRDVFCQSCVSLYVRKYTGREIPDGTNRLVIPIMIFIVNSKLIESFPIYSYFHFSVHSYFNFTSIHKKILFPYKFYYYSYFNNYFKIHTCKIRHQHSAINNKISETRVFKMSREVNQH